MRDNHTKHVIESGNRAALGVSITISDPFVAEAIGGAGFDFVMVDTEHAPISIDVLQSILIGLARSESTVFVRPASNDPTLIKQILDLGAEGVIVPEVHDAAGCAAAVAATRYPPAGSRGFGPRRAGRLAGGRAEYIARANDEIAAFVMIENANAVENIDAILSAPGLDGIMVGPADLAVSLGHLNNLQHPEVQAAVDRVLAACRSRSFPFGIFAGTEQAARQWVGRGARFATIGSDVQFIDQGLARTVTLAAELSKL